MTVSTRINQTDIEKIINNRESRQHQGLVPVQQNIQRSESLQFYMEEIESYTDRNLSTLFQDSDDSSVDTEQAVVQALVQANGWGALRLATQGMGKITNQLKLR